MSDYLDHFEDHDRPGGICVECDAELDGEFTYIFDDAQWCSDCLVWVLAEYVDAPVTKLIP
jgi:hypothetical protein